MFQLAVILIPVFMLAVGIEWYVSHRRKDHKYSTGNTMMNLTIGAVDQVGGLVHMALLYLVMDYVFQHYRLFTVHHGWYQWLFGYIAVDFISYWYHRFSHRVNILWAGHITHHSSEWYNLSNSFRTSLFQGFNRIVFWAFLPLFGLEPINMIVIFKVSGLYEFFLHTEYIPKLGFLEKILITPSAHRVHHGKNDIYIDKNFGANLVVWDKIFGTYQEETEPVVYGVKADYTDDDPVKAIGTHYMYLFRSMAKTRRFSDKLKWLYMPPEWQANSTENIQEEIPEKAGVSLPSKWKNYSYFQLGMGTIGVLITLGFQDYLSVWDMVVCFGIFLLSMCQATRMLHSEVLNPVGKNHILTYGILIIPLLFSILVFNEMYLMPLLWYQLVLLVYTGLLSERIKSREWNSGDLFY